MRRFYVLYKRSKNFDKSRRQKILRHSQDRDKAVDNGFCLLYTSDAADE